MRMASGNLAGRWSSPPTGVDSTCPADTARYPASPAHPTSPTDEPPAGPRRVPRPLRQPDAPRAAGQVQALDARLDMVLAESPGDDADLHADLPLRAADPGRPRRPERSSDICRLASVRAVALDVPGQRADRSDGESDLQREPHTEGVLPEGGARRRDDRGVAGVGGDRVRRARNRPADRGQHDPALASRRHPVARDPDRIRARTLAAVGGPQRVLPG